MELFAKSKFYNTNKENLVNITVVSKTKRESRGTRFTFYNNFAHSFGTENIIVGYDEDTNRLYFLPASDTGYKLSTTHNPDSRAITIRNERLTDICALNVGYYTTVEKDDTGYYIQLKNRRTK